MTTSQYSLDQHLLKLQQLFGYDKDTATKQLASNLVSLNSVIILNSQSN